MTPAGPARKAERRGPGRFGGHPVWIGYLAVAALIELMLVAADNGLLGSARWRAWAYQNGAFWEGILYGWQPNFALQPAVMFLSYGVLHAGVGHLIGNVAVIAWLGRAIGGRIGPLGMGLVLLSVILGGGIGYGLLATTLAPMVGASGAAMGLIGVWIVWDAGDMRREGLPARRIAWGTGARIVLVLVLNVVSFVALGGVLAWQTHLGGFLSGALVAALLSPSRPASGRA